MKIERLVWTGADANRVGAGLDQRRIGEIYSRPAPVLPAIDDSVGVNGPDPIVPAL